MTDENKTAQTSEQEVKTATDLAIEELKKQNELLAQQNKALADANKDLWAILHPANDKQIVVNKEKNEAKTESYDIVADIKAKLKAL